MLHLGGYQILSYFYLQQSLGFYVTFTRNIHNINYKSSLLNYTCLGTTTNFAGEQVHTILNEKLADFRGVKQFNTNVESEKKRANERFILELERPAEMGKTPACCAAFSATMAPSAEIGSHWRKINCYNRQKSMITRLFFKASETVINWNEFR